MPVTVRQAPFTAMLSPSFNAVSGFGVSIVTLVPPPFGATRLMRPVASMMPVNIEAVGAQ